MGCLSMRMVMFMMDSGKTIKLTAKGPSLTQMAPGKLHVVLFRWSSHGNDFVSRLSGYLSLCSYKGQWFEDMQQGYGVEKWCDGSTYEGQYL
jgi:hypothetical protein